METTTMPIMHKHPAECLPVVKAIKKYRIFLNTPHTFFPKKL
jgi:hypothetical protein